MVRPHGEKSWIEIHRILCKSSDTKQDTFLHPTPSPSTLHLLPPPYTFSLHPTPSPSTPHFLPPPYTFSLHPTPSPSTLHLLPPPYTFSLHPTPSPSTLHLLPPPYTFSLHPALSPSPLHLLPPQRSKPLILTHCRLTFTADESSKLALCGLSTLKHFPA
ncbi:hypothetical protein RRG08_016275 [Elysia crispata]|uniref:Uncharacterized protein n=1 Tax=Elysia crispata TaxID=231223 RepID=A0AAE1E0V8_9GAST|nr:hypothetical protein RRG08_016275 [Elysia crispata]